MSVMTVRIVQRHFYNTFQERGVVMPFTTPRLVGTRVRRSARGADLELMLPNPGGAGFYILTWPNMRNVARPTVHDMQLYAALSNQPTLTPAAVRRVCRATALRGLAGRAAAAAAAAADALEKNEARQVVAQLLTRLVEQTEPPGTRPRLAEDTASGITRREDAAVLAAAARLSQPPLRVRSGIAVLGEMFNQLRGGHPGSAASAWTSREPGPVMQLILAVERISSDIGGWATLSHEASSQMARELNNAAVAVATCGRAVASEVARQLDSPLELLGKLFTSPDLLAQFAARPDWTINGWEQIAARWQLPGEDWRSFDRLKELQPLIPAMPKQVADWGRLRVDFDMITLPPDNSATPDRAEAQSHMFEQTSRLETLQAALLRPQPVRAPAAEAAVA